MTTRKIVNITSTKKRDTLLPYTNMNAPRPIPYIPTGENPGTTWATGGAQMMALTNQYVEPYTMVYCPTARSSTTDEIPNQRNKSRVYWRGLKESIEIQVDNGTPWQWRRVCFTVKGAVGTYASLADTRPMFLPQFDSANNQARMYLWSESSNGYVRPVNPLPGQVTSGSLGLLYQRMFRGQFGQDWHDPMTAALDRQRLTIKYDKTISIAAGNESGAIRKFKRWHGMNSTLVYDEDESGGTNTTAPQSVTSKAGMGDYYVVDMFRSRFGTDTSKGMLMFHPSAQVYWHEK